MNGAIERASFKTDSVLELTWRHQCLAKDTAEAKVVGSESCNPYKRSFMSTMK